MENLQNLLANVGNWMGYPICDLICSETNDEVEDLSKIDYDLWLDASDARDLEKVLCLAGCLVKVDDLGDDYFEYDEKNLMLVGRNTGKKFEIGQQVRVQVANADIETGRIDFVFPGFLERARAQEENRGRKRDEAKGKRRVEEQRGSGGSSKSGKTNRFDSEKRGKAEDHRGNSGKARVRKRR
jgi:hypothetical protein